MLAVYAFVIFATVSLSVLWTIRHGGLLAGAVAALFYLAWSGVFGYWAMYYDLVLGLLYLLLFLLLARPVARQSAWSMLLCGCLAGVAVLVKQHAVFLIFPLAYWLYLQVRVYAKLPAQTMRMATAFVLGFVLCTGAYLFYYDAQASRWDEFVYWTFTYNVVGDYSSQGIKLPSTSEIRTVLPALLLAIPFVFGLFTIRVADRRLPRSTALWLIIFAAVAIAPLYPRYSSRHLASVAPFLAMMSGLAVAQALEMDRVPDWRGQTRRVLYIAVTVLWVILAVRAYATRVTPSHPRRFGEYDNLAPLATILADRLPPGADIVLFPQDEAVANLYYLLDRPPPHYWLMHYPWFLTPRAVERWVAAVEDAQPEMVIYFSERGDPEHDSSLREFVADHYVTVDELMWDNQIVELMRRRDADSLAQPQQP